MSDSHKDRRSHRRKVGGSVKGAQEHGKRERRRHREARLKRRAEGDRDNL